MLKMRRSTSESTGLTNFTNISGLAESLPFADAAFDVVFMVTVLGEVADRATDHQGSRSHPAPRRAFFVNGRRPETRTA